MMGQEMDQSSIDQPWEIGGHQHKAIHISQQVLSKFSSYLHPDSAWLGQIQQVVRPGFAPPVAMRCASLRGPPVVVDQSAENRA